MDQDRFCILSRKEAKWKAFLVSEFGKENLQVDLGGTDPYVHAPSSSSAAQVSTSSDRAIERTHSVDSTDTLPAEPAEPTDESGMTLNPIALQQYAVQRRASLLDNLEHNLNVSRTRTDSLIKTMESDLQSLRNSFEKGRPSALKSVPEAS
ncbi:hypothetical protein CAOG_00097 [Capsaspora owczarzaki ATCC 30864]|uniref:Uncharacterized protein n=1 Tax=Capsaspora owczarzaki (strain ATCC 30864) TaxID=595528 RepID=A0A0D2X049_CAPO3|nr:hypothetical protein CAOG_00097 [Capsaspora owczarzaki ATCC 30864]KJE88439.1 hypothetical protein CAOG_000097 [Capsaspora owczarzaki ATCC 30864]|eukprot:XP_004364968.1 hypothetical protein CAOG_00097 [Capsaspora owczarzaki ATCC 30864]